MQSITYNISNAYFPVTVYLKDGVSPGTTIVATNTHNFAGEYSFDDVYEAQYTIHVVDVFGCEKFINVPAIAGDCDLEGDIDCNFTTTIEPTTTA